MGKDSIWEVGRLSSRLPEHIDYPSPPPVLLENMTTLMFMSKRMDVPNFTFGIAIKKTTQTTCHTLG